MPLRSVSIDELRVGDERAYRHIGLYDELKQTLRCGGYRFRILEGSEMAWERALFLTVTFGASTDQGEVLPSVQTSADVVMRAGLRHVVSSVLREKGVLGLPDAWLFREALSAAFDIHLVGRLLGHGADADLLELQVPAMREAAEAQDLTDEDFEELLGSIADDPDRAFSGCRELLYDVSRELFPCSDPAAALTVLERFGSHPFAPLIHAFDLSSWILSARAQRTEGKSELLAELDTALRSAPVALDWIERNWVNPHGE